MKTLATIVIVLLILYIIYLFVLNDSKKEAPLLPKWLLDSFIIYNEKIMKVYQAAVQRW